MPIPITVTTERGVMRVFFDVPPKEGEAPKSWTYQAEYPNANGETMTIHASGEYGMDDESTVRQVKEQLGAASVCGAAREKNHHA